MQKSIALFRKTFAISVFFTILFTLFFQGLIFSFDIFVSSNKNYLLLNNSYSKLVFSWLVKSLNEASILSMFMLFLPWLMLSFFSEFFYTRSLQRKELLKLILIEYLKWFLPLNALIFILKIINTQFFHNNGNYFMESLFVSSLSFYLCLIVAGNTKTFIKSLKYGLPVFIFSAIFSNLPVFTFSIAFGNLFEAGQKISFLLWFIYVFYVYKFTFNYNDDIELVTAGKADDENLAMSKLKVFTKEFYSKEIKLVEYKSYLAKKLNIFKFISKPIFSFYTNYLFIILLIVLYFTIKTSVLYFTNSKESLIYQDQLPITLMFIVSLSLILLSPKFILLPKEELIFTRAISKKEIYWNSFLAQGISILVLLSITFLISILGLFGIEFNNFTLIIITLWLYVSGELGLVFLLTLILSFISPSVLNLDSNPSIYLLFSFFISLENMGLFSIGIWFLALIIRFLDYKWFCNKEIGLFKGFSNTIKNLAKLYLPSLAVIVIMLPAIFHFNPLIQFLNLPRIDFYEYYFNTVNIVDSIFYKSRGMEKNEYVYYEEDYYNNTKSFEKLIKNPYDEVEYLKISTNYLNKLFSNDILTYRKLGVKKIDKVKFSATMQKVEYLNNLVKNSKETPEYFYNQTLYYYLQGKYDLAESFLKKATIETKGKYHLILASIYEKNNQTDKALDNYKKVLKYAETNRVRDFYLTRWFLLRKIGNVCLNLKKYDEALNYFVYEDKKGFITGYSFFNVDDYKLPDLCEKLENLKKERTNKKLLENINSYLSEKR